eukprot:CAMPEP_0119105122 /NCGR_PEP_ID=MMETSP1180-20130426/3177_1 /TAXON_ID=3052 ORGANISM="Chlamydomonas cf sp, Strain CCMP681" /NCGR_SAMPLE_ID=MMETSP1180 /ASSEMBLY_ACC=CAM_ASM_000741 /LENGTH=118 /DNA_ID=CAMNT_0007090103 /DNA_START=172 /DNA_END=528 /DNA_ORIENTATION=-
MRLPLRACYQTAAKARLLATCTQSSSSSSCGCPRAGASPSPRASPSPSASPSPGVGSNAGKGDWWRGLPKLSRVRSVRWTCCQSSGSKEETEWRSLCTEGDRRIILGETDISRRSRSA